MKKLKTLTQIQQKILVGPLLGDGGALACSTEKKI